MQQQYADDTQLYDAISIETLLSPSWRGAWTNYIFGFAETVFHSTPTKQMQYYLELPCDQKQFQPSTPLMLLECLSRCLTASRFSASYLTKISPSTSTFLTFPNHVSTIFDRFVIYDQHSQTMLPRWSLVPYSAVASITPTRCSSAPGYLYSRIGIATSRRTLRSSADTRKLSVIPSRTKIGARTFRHSAPQDWNSLK